MALDAATGDPASEIPSRNTSSRGRQSRHIRRARLMATALLVVLLGIVLVRALFMAVTPISRPSAEAPLRDAEPRPIDLTIFTRFDPFKGNAPAVDPVVETANETRLNLKLYGIYLGDPASATVLGEDGKQGVYAIGETIAPGVTVRDIRNDHILINREGVTETLSLENRDRSASPVGGGSGPVRSQVEAASSALQPFGQYVRVQPSPEGGVLLFPGSDPQFFEAAGFVAGDRLIVIDGAGLSSNATGLANLPARLQQGPVEVIVMRDGTRIELEIDLTGLTP